MGTGKPTGITSRPMPSPGIRPCTSQQPRLQCQESSDYLSLTFLKPCLGCAAIGIVVGFLLSSKFIKCGESPEKRRCRALQLLNRRQSPSWGQPCCMFTRISTPLAYERMPPLLQSRTTMTVSQTHAKVRRRRTLKSKLGGLTCRFNVLQTLNSGPGYTSTRQTHKHYIDSLCRNLTISMPTLRDARASLNFDKY